jgi:hypothetical protein
MRWKWPVHKNLNKKKVLLNCILFKKIYVTKWIIIFLKVNKNKKKYNKNIFYKTSFKVTKFYLKIKKKKINFKFKFRKLMFQQD